VTWKFLFIFGKKEKSSIFDHGRDTIISNRISIFALPSAAIISGKLNWRCQKTGFDVLKKLYFPFRCSVLVGSRLSGVCYLSFEVSRGVP